MNGIPRATAERIYVNDVGFTGSRSGMTARQKYTVALLVAQNGYGSAGHGDCEGSDEDFHRICLKDSLSVVLHPPVSDAFRAFCEGAAKVLEPRPYLERNHDIVDNSREMIATPAEYEEQRRSGTWATIRYARSKAKPLYIVYPDGAYTMENVT